ncbi:molybdopterin molybdotransferase MoeA [Aspergillus novofumigatus IBT 16806]|uniref:molybdopterin adenylyltransferase n=1 Tax=Aspergillus novofumigatus (strain IBT 16806) TaxID=1392255 RepID=A0A2I1BTB9_ASPN1|nr:molybdopterin biosynthesis protein [Aspergillus novofumigatus IBT 16806]PKX88657.1 molybdopterin biosynthesis protein [Aspergillus novofumigatus IBT 16806]
MAIHYPEALQLIQAEAQRHRDAFVADGDHVPISQARNRIARETVTSQISTPKFDTSAMDGYALSSSATQDATIDQPVIFEVKGSIAAGDEPLLIAADEQSGRLSAVTGDELDCCVRNEDVAVTVDETSNRRYIRVFKPAKARQNRRLAGSDFKKSDILVDAGEVVHPGHILSLASVGITEIAVIRKPRVAVMSTGSELLPPGLDQSPLHRISDANGPYLSATLESWGASVDFLGIVHDHAESLEHALSSILRKKEYDVIITSGAVSAGRCDLIPEVIRRLNARVVFHKVAMRPGHPVLFARIPDSSSTDGHFGRATAFFGLPGNPVASAACLRFLVLPYLKYLQLQPPDDPSHAYLLPPDDVESSTTKEPPVVSTFRGDMDVFRPALVRGSSGHVQVKLIQDHSPGKIKPFLHSNCWIHIHQGVCELNAGDIVDIYPSH